MTNLEMTMIKEVTYEFKYNGDKNLVDHYVDDKLNLRHQVNSNNNLRETLMTLNVHGTKQPYQVIEAELVGERVYFTDEIGQIKAELFYLLPDINYYIKLTYYKEYEFETWNVLWSSQLSFDLYQSEGGN